MSIRAMNRFNDKEQIIIYRDENCQKKKFKADDASLNKTWKVEAE